MALHIRQLHLQNFRGAAELPLTLHPRLNVFAAPNGGGKSTVLDAAAIGLTVIVRNLLPASGEGFGIAEGDICNGENHAAVKTVFRVDKETAIEWTTTQAREGQAAFGMAKTQSAASDFAARLLHANGNGDTHFPVLAYYPVNRAVLHIPLRIRDNIKLSNIAAYKGALSTGTNFRVFFEWFRHREDLENELCNSLFAKSGLERFLEEDHQLRAVRGALKVFMPDFSGWRVRRDEPLRMEVQKCGKALTVNQLSHGEKCLLALVGDIARRLAIANPRSDDPLQGQGVVLIDEVDLHLHPEWQRMVVPRLLQVFPNCQFLLSTHSPHVINHVREGEVFLLRQGEEGLSAAPARAPYGKTTERIEVDFMGVESVRPVEIKEKIAAIHERIDSGAFDSAREAIRALREEIGNDPDLTAAEVAADCQEILENETHR